MAKKRLSLDLDLEDYNDKKIWDYLETKDKERLDDTELLNKDGIDPSGFVGF